MTSLVMPATLTPGANENVNDLNSDLNAIVSWANGNVDETNVPNLTAAFTTYKNLPFRGAAQINGGTGAATYALFQGPSLAVNSGAVGASPAFTMFYIDAADFAANARTTKLRLRFTAVTNATAPAITMTAGLYPVASIGGAASAAPTVASLGAVVAGSTAAVATPAVSSASTATGTEFNFPSVGNYVLAFVTSGALAATANVDLIAYLQMRQL